MKISKQAGNALCHSILQSLLKWNALTAALQCGGLERIGEGRIYDGIERWLNRQDERTRRLLLLSQYQKTDYAFIDPKSVGQPRLQVDTVFEAKFSYAVQLSHAVPSAIEGAANQLNGYRAAVGARNGYILYFIAGPVWANVVGQPRKRDAGWHYWRIAGKAPVPTSEKQRIASACKTLTLNGRNKYRITGEHEAMHGGHWLYCVLIQVS